jgi:type VI secretion system protein VasJ
MDIESRAATWSQPISESEPTGENCRYDDDYEQVNAELKKLQSLEGLQPDWGRVLQLSSQLLSQKTKDTNIFTALCVALMNLEGFAGLAAGFTAFEAVCREHWQTMFPPVKRLRGRAGDLTWMMQQVSAWIETVTPEADAHEELKACLDAFDALDGTLRELLADLYPAVGAFRRPLTHYLEQTAPAAGAGEAAAEAEAWAAERTPQDAAPAAGGAEAPPTQGASLVPDHIDNEDQAQQVVDQATRALEKAAEFYAEHAERLEQERKALVGRIQHARRVVKIRDNVSTMLEGGEDEEDEDEEDEE